MNKQCNFISGLSPNYKPDLFHMRAVNRCAMLHPIMMEEAILPSLLFVFQPHFCYNDSKIRSPTASCSICSLRFCLAYAIVLTCISEPSLGNPSFRKSASYQVMAVHLRHCKDYLHDNSCTRRCRPSEVLEMSIEIGGSDNQH